MIFEKIKQIKPGFADTAGPNETITIGLKAGKHSFILGTVYSGQYEDDTQLEWLKKVEKIVDIICENGKDKI